MTRFAAALVGTALILGGVMVDSAELHAAPPTVVPSPGYDARLRQSRHVPMAAPAYAVPAPAHVRNPHARNPYVEHRRRMHPHRRVGDRNAF
jgi:hypothetical protein